MVKYSEIKSQGEPQDTAATVVLEVKAVEDIAEKQKIKRTVLEALQDWFGVSESRENYTRESAENPYIATYDGKCRRTVR